MNYQYLHEFIDLRVEKAVKYHIFNSDKNWLVYFTNYMGSGAGSRLRGRIRSKTGQDPQHTVLSIVAPLYGVTHRTVSVRCLTVQGPYS
jgi:hypothetical protein